MFAVCYTYILGCGSSVNYLSWASLLTRLFFDLMKESSVPPLTFSISMNTCSLENRIRLNIIIFSWVRSWSTYCSIVSFPTLNIYFEFSYVITFNATTSSECLFLASRTIPKAPTPRIAIMVYNYSNLYLWPLISISAFDMFGILNFSLSSVLIWSNTSSVHS